jgi:alanyl-tRNA synthetase
MEESIEGARLHTAEHIFARALQEQDLNIHVRKADTYREDNVGKMYIKEIIPFEKIVEAEKIVNSKIIENLTVKEENFKNLEDAMKKNPKLRFNEDRLDKEKEVRVVTIGNYDFSACKHLHAKLTSEITMFAVKYVSYLGGETEIDFLAGNDALLFLLRLKNEVLKIAMGRHFAPEKLSDYAKNENERIIEMEREEKEMLYKLLEGSSGLITLKGVKLSKFYGEINYFIKTHAERCVGITNGQQIIIMKGKECRIDLLKAGEKIKALGFNGSINENSINGRVDERTIEEIDKLWKA